MGYFVRITLVLLGCVALHGWSVADPADEHRVVTSHRLSLPDEELSYSAEAGRVAIRHAETGEPRGHMFYVAYRLNSPRKRPIAFVWNGGPGANSALLHFEAAGPYRWQYGSLVENADTWLTHMDLVFVDPIGTGFSRPAKEEYANEFYGTLGDVASVTEFVRAWRLLHGVEEEPLLLVGESWGAGRAGSVGFALEKRGVDVDGLVLISGGTGITDEPLPEHLEEALRIVDYSTTAHFHGELSPQLGDSAAEVRRTVETWARERYAPAIQRIEELGAAERRVIAGELSLYSGLGDRAIDRDTLVVTPRAYRHGLLDHSGRRLQVFDMRRTDGMEKADSDTGRSRSWVIPRYLRHTLGYTTTLPYVPLEPIEHAYAPEGEFPPPVNARWDYATADLGQEEREAAIAAAIQRGGGPPRLGPPLPSAAEAVELNPDLKVLVAVGRYDSLNSCTANEELNAHLSDDLKAAYMFRCYEGGHMMYRDEEARARLAADVRELATLVEAGR